jgi:hypothetical protein
MAQRTPASGVRVAIGMRNRALTVALLVGALAVPAAVATDAGAAKPKPRSAKKLRLAVFDDCSDLVSYARRYAPRVEPYYGSDGVSVTGPAPPSGSEGGSVTDTPSSGPAPQTAAPTPGDSSSTNVQEQGVDEPDIVKTDGKTIFAVSDGLLHAVDARATEPRLLDSLRIDGYSHQLLVHGRRALVTSYVAVESPGGPPVGPATSPADGYYRVATLLTEVDIGDPADLKVVRTETIDGGFVSARLAGDTARVVISTPPAALEPGVADTAERRIAGWVPSSTVVNRRTGKTRTRRIVSCRAVRHPRTFAGLEMLTVLTIDMSRGLPAIDADALMTGAQDIYASTSGLYVATHRWTPPATAPDQLAPSARTAIHRFDTSDPRSTTYKSSGEVPGYVLNQWSMSEYKGVLRVASTQSPEWWSGRQPTQSQSFVTTLAERDGALVELGRVGGLGVGERIYAVRMIDDAGYVVTFRQTDPLYTVDLSTPTAPRVLGELKIQGYSAYLHPLGPDLLLGIGQDATPQGRTLGTQVSIFDVSDLRNPQRIHQRRLGTGGSSSEVEWDHHAFLYWAPRELAVLPLAEYRDPEPSFIGAVGLRVNRAGIDEVGRIAHDWPSSYPVAIQRSVVVGDRIFTVSQLGVKASDLATFADRGRAEFPQARQPDPVVTPAPPVR